MVIFESEFGKTTLFSAKITFYSLLLATKKVLVRNCGCSRFNLEVAPGAVFADVSAGKMVFFRFYFLFPAMDYDHFPDEF